MILTTDCVDDGDEVSEIFSASRSSWTDVARVSRAALVAASTGARTSRLEIMLETKTKALMTSSLSPRKEETDTSTDVDDAFSM
jgi:hypothetical protein